MSKYLGFDIRNFVIVVFTNLYDIYIDVQKEIVSLTKLFFLHFKIITTTLHLTYQRLDTAIDSITELDSFLYFVNMQCKVSATKVASYLRERLQCWHIYYNCLEKFHGIRDSCHILKRLLFRSRTYSTNANVPNGTLVPHNLP